MFLLGLQAAAWRVPFLPTRVGLGSDILRDNDRVRMVTSPFADGEELVAVPALRMDAAFVHMNRADARGNGQYLGPDPYMDDLFLGAADRRFLSAEQIIPTEDLAKEGPPQSLLISRLLVDGVIEAPNGAHFTSCDPDYPRDEAFQKQYAASAKNAEAWAEFRDRYVDVTEAEYQAAVAGGAK
jgi:glutaconate CoA-transferase subunit A